jgi:hypothetical protein
MYISRQDKESQARLAYVSAYAWSRISEGIERHRWAATELLERSVRKVELLLLLDEAAQPDVVFADEQNIPG